MFKAYTLLIGLATLSCCSPEKPTPSTRLDASAVLEHPRVLAEIRAYSQRNPASEGGIYYLDALRRGDSTRLTLSSLISQSQVNALHSCAFTRFAQEWVLVKTGNCPPVESLDSLLHRYVPGKVMDDLRRRCKVTPQGDTLEFHENVFYDPEVVFIDFYRNKLIAVHRDL
ncbi:hypothetical protein [Hymenobacter sp. YC55]|uniref:hypothetical protein n=1 Tax=Hymenobacter sp. YC55 TaxID=3034019 RepID=UPI0023F97CE6|nr:hypothetical protein [Hymenobacter sp. YC55]MDF7815907.1 hypothetical protein [Hymenobacter sp. YC55]